MVVQARHYYTFGMEMSQLNNGTTVNKYQYNGKELQDDFGLYWYDYGARYYDPMVGRWHTIDPLAHEFPAWSPYSAFFNNPIRYIDPTGMAPDEFNVDKNSGQITKVNNKGGSETDYYNVGTATSNGEFKTDQTITVGRGKGSINSFRFKEGPNSTASTFNIPGTDIKGNIIEPGGPSTTQSGKDKRIPEGSYNVMKNDGSEYPSDFKIFNSDVSKKRGIVIHSGNTGVDTKGCLLPGRGVIKDDANSGDYKTQGGTSRTTRDQIRGFIKEKGAENVKVNIYNIITK